MQFWEIHHSLASKLCSWLQWQANQGWFWMVKFWEWNIYACPFRPLAGWRAGCSPLALSCCVMYWTGVLSLTLEWPKAVVDWHHHICDFLFWAFTSVQGWRSQSPLIKQHWREVCVLQLWDQLFFTTAPLSLAHCPSHLSPRSAFMAPTT